MAGTPDTPQDIESPNEPEGLQDTAVLRVDAPASADEATPPSDTPEAAAVAAGATVSDAVSQDATPQRRSNWLPWAVAGVACLVAAGALVYAGQVARQDGDSAAKSPLALNQQPASGKTSSPSSAGSVAGAQGTQVPAGTSPQAGAAPGGTTKGGTSSSTRTVTPTGPGAVGGAPAPSVAKTGSTLATLSVPPEHTVGLLKIEEGVKSAAYNVKFKPYGWGPGGPERGNLVVAVTSSSPAGGDAAKLLDLSGKNASFWVADPAVIPKVKTGGSYTGKVSVRIEGDTGRLMLISADLEQ